MDNKQEAVPNEEDSAERIKILNSILDEIVKLKITAKNYENALYKREQVQEAAQVEKFTEEAPATKEGQGKESGGKTGPLEELEKNPAIKKLTDFANNIISILRPALLTLVAFAPVLIALIKKAVPFIKELPSMIYDKMKEALDFLGPIFKEYIVDPVHKFFTINLPAAWDVLSMVIGDAITNLLYFPLTVINQIKQFAEEIQINALTSFIDFVKTSKLVSWLGIDVTAVTEGAEKMVGAATARKEGLQKEQQARDEEKAGIASTSYTEQYDKGVAKRTEAAKKEEEAGKKEGAVPKVQGMDDIKKMIMKHEGVRNQAYKDSKGLWTIGVGHLIGNGSSPGEYAGKTLTDKEVQDLFEEDFAHHVKIAEKTPGWDLANETGKGAMIDLAFNMGAWWKKFKNAAAALKAGDFNKGADELVHSAWYSQVGNRAKEVVSMIRAGKGTGEEKPGTAVASGNKADSIGNEINTASMGAKIEEPGATTTIVNAQASAQGPVDVTPDKTSKNKPNSAAIQNSYHRHLGVALTG